MINGKSGSTVYEQSPMQETSGAMKLGSISHLAQGSRVQHVFMAPVSHSFLFISIHMWPGSSVCSS